MARLHPRTLATRRSVVGPSDTDGTAVFTARQDVGARHASSRDHHAGLRDDAGFRDYDEYRAKLYKVACRAARERREALATDSEERNRERC